MCSPYPPDNVKPPPPMRPIEVLIAILLGLGATAVVVFVVEVLL